MQVRILGAHQGESRDLRFISILIDDRLAIDAGGLTTSLTLDEQKGIEALLLTHQHYDHVKDLPMLAHNLWEEQSLQVYCTFETRQVLQRYILNGIIWPDMTKVSPGFYPVVFHAVEPGTPLDLLGYHIIPVPMRHTVLTVGYCVTRDGKSVFYAADTRAEGDPEWIALRPDLLIIETTMSNRYDEDAARFKHLTPTSLERELRAYHAKQGYYPRTVCVHLNPKHDQQIREELTDLARELGADISAAREGMVIDV